MTNESIWCRYHDTHNIDNIPGPFCQFFVPRQMTTTSVHHKEQQKVKGLSGFSFLCRNLSQKGFPKPTLGVPALGLEGGLPPEGVCFQIIQIIRLFIQCVYLGFDPDSPIFYPYSGEIPPASQELLLQMDKRGESGLLRLWSDQGVNLVYTWGDYSECWKLPHITQESHSWALAITWKFGPFLAK